jgi:hypothetical protein
LDLGLALVLLEGAGAWPTPNKAFLGGGDIALPPSESAAGLTAAALFLTDLAAELAELAAMDVAAAEAALTFAPLEMLEDRAGAAASLAAERNPGLPPPEGGTWATAGLGGILKS